MSIPSPEVRRSTWTSYPHSDYADVVDATYAHAAALDAWRAFLQPPILGQLHAGGAQFSIESSGRHQKGTCEFQSTTKEATARAIIESLAIATLPAAFDFLRFRLLDPRAFAYLPLSCFAPCDSRSVPTIAFSIHKHWSVLLEHFTIGHYQKNYARHTTLLFNHPQLASCWSREGEVIADIVFEKRFRSSNKRELLFAEADDKEDSGCFTITERAVLRRLNGAPSHQPE